MAWCHQETNHYLAADFCRRMASLSHIELIQTSSSTLFEASVSNNSSEVRAYITNYIPTSFIYLIPYPYSKPNASLGYVGKIGPWHTSHMQMDRLNCIVHMTPAHISIYSSIPATDNHDHSNLNLCGYHNNLYTVASTLHRRYTCTLVSTCT